MGVSSSSDESCQHSDRAIEGMPFAKKIVDDILVWANDLPTLYDRVRSIAKRCADLNIALPKKKIAVGTELSFEGLIFSAEGIKPDPERIVSLSNFPVPKDVTGVRKFLGLANQLSGFVSDFAYMTVRLRELTAKKNAFLWLEEHQHEFEKGKELLTSEIDLTELTALQNMKIFRRVLHSSNSKPTYFQRYFASSISLTATYEAVRGRRRIASPYKK